MRWPIVTITRVGTNAKYADGWDAAFGRTRNGKAAKKSGKKAAGRKKPAAKKAGRKAR
jgi:hypothetical protein